METKVEKVLQVMQTAGKPLKAGEIADAAGLDKKEVDKAMKVLKARLYDIQMQEKMDSEGASRKEQVGTGDRSGRIRTYNYPQGRISDHRINLTLYRLEAVMNDGVFDEIIDPLITDAQSKAIEANGL